MIETFLLTSLKNKNILFQISPHSKSLEILEMCKIFRNTSCIPFNSISSFTFNVIRLLNSGLSANQRQEQESTQAEFRSQKSESNFSRMYQCRLRNALIWKEEVSSKSYILQGIQEGNSLL